MFFALRFTIVLIEFPFLSEESLPPFNNCSAWIENSISLIPPETNLMFSSVLLVKLKMMMDK